MNICEEETKEKLTTFIAGHLYKMTIKHKDFNDHKHDLYLKMVSSAKPFFINVKDAATRGEIPDDRDRSCWFDVTDQYCLKKIS